MGMKATRNVETPQDPNRALRRMHTGGVVRHTSQPTIETGACIESLPIAVALMRGGFQQPADLPTTPHSNSRSFYLLFWPFYA